jgi:hypothetical protein
LALFACLTVAWTWPLLAHLHDALPGNPGDNYSFVWNLWWMRLVLATPGLGYFHTQYLFYPFGTTIADHPHTALPAFIAATMLRSASPATAQNVLLLAYVFANLAASAPLRGVSRSDISSMAALIFDFRKIAITCGHFDLVAAWPLPLYALFLNRAMTGHSRRSAVAAGLVFGATAYIAYYYVVFIGALTLVVFAFESRALTMAMPKRAPANRARTVRLALVGLACAFAIGAAVIATSGGGSLAFGQVRISARTPQNALTLMWLAILLWALLTWRPVLAIDVRSTTFRRATSIAAYVFAAFVVVSAPLLWQAARLVAGHEYVTQQYFWRSAPRGVDLLSPLLGHPLHPLFGARSGRAYAAIQADYIESIGWLGIAPMILLGLTSGIWRGERRLRVWRILGLLFGIWALGPFLTIGGFDTGLKLPAILLRFVPLVSNARMPGRAIVVVYMAVALLVAYGVSKATGRLRSPLVQRMPSAWWFLNTGKRRSD